MFDPQMMQAMMAQQPGQAGMPNMGNPGNPGMPRQQALAMALMQQGMTPPQGKVTPLGGLNQALQGGMGAYLYTHPGMFSPQAMPPAATDAASSAIAGMNGPAFTMGG